MWSHSIRLQSHCHENLIVSLSNYRGKTLYLNIEEEKCSNMSIDCQMDCDEHERERERDDVSVSGPVGLLAFNFSCFEVLDDSDKKPRD